MTSVSRLLLVDDEPALVGVLQPALEATGHRVSVAIDGASALKAVGDIDPHIILLDLGLPDIDGKKVIRLIRQRSDAPIIVISARHQELEKIAALDEGADDYVNKPFKIGELMARVRAAMRRVESLMDPPRYVQTGILTIDLLGRRVTVGGDPVRLSPKEWSILNELAVSAGQVVTHKRLLAAGWGSELQDAQYLRVYIGLLREKLEAEPSQPSLILTEPGIGYRLAQPEEGEPRS